MENHTQNIELINNYLNKRLSESELQNFENRLKTDSDFNTLFDEHTTFLEGIKRQQLKTEIVKGRQSFIRNKWFKSLGIISSGLLVLFTVVYFNVFNSDKEEYLKNKLNFESEYIQNFHVAIDSIIEIVGEKGTIIRFNPNDLETNSNKPFIGDSLEVELIELTTKQDLLLAKAQTISNGKWLISGGAFKIDIKANGKSLILKEGETIDAQFPKNTSENGMQIFYGERDRENNMNWEVSSIKLEEEKYYTIVFRDSNVLDFVLTKQFGVDMYKGVVLSDTLGYLKYKNIADKFPEIEDIKIDNDTLRVYDVTFRHPYSNLETDNFFGDAEVLQRKYISISKSEIENVIKHIGVDYVINEESLNLYNKVTNGFYESIELSKLGWINIDKFAREEETVSIKLEFNVNTSFNEIYIVDQKNNTVLNVYNHDVDLPVNRSFYIIAVGIKGKDIYGFKKSLRVNKSGDFKIEYKKITEDQIKSILTIQNSIGEDNVSSRNKDKTIIIDPDTSKDLSEDEVIGENTKTVSKLEENQTSFQSEKTPQKLKINTQKDTVLVLKEGTKLSIKANSFVDAKSNLVNGTIDLNVTEYYKLSDILLANLSTTSNGKQLETGGMLYVEAKKGEANLALRENSSIEISFPTASKKEDMQLFSGEWKNGIINWQLENKTEEVIVEEIDEDIEVPFAVIEEVPIYPSCEEGDQAEKRRCMSDAISKFVKENFNANIAVSLGLKGRLRVNSIFKINKYGNTSFIRSRGTHPRIEEEANRVIALLPKMQPGKQRGKTVTVPYSLPIILTISEDRQSVSARTGSLEGRNISFTSEAEMDTTYTSARGQVELIREVMHDKNFQVDSTFIETWESYTKDRLIRFYGENNNVILRKPLFEMENTKFKVLDDDSISRGGHIIRKLWNESKIPTTSRIMSIVPKENVYIGREKLTKEEFENRLKDKEDVSIRATDVSSYALRALELGWINCDRFIRGRNRIKYKLKIKNANDTNITMVFKSVNSILPSKRFGKEFDFNTVPKNEDVTLVAIKKQKGKLYLDIVDTKTKENPDLEFNFKEVSLEEMKNELEKLNNLFN